MGEEMKLENIGLQDISKENHSMVLEFVLLGLTNSSQLRIPFFIFFLVVYLFTLLGNLGMILLIRIDSQLHTPMYFFLSKLSFVDLCYSSVVTPKLLMDFVVKNNTISWGGCAAQMWFFGLFVAIECHLLASMAYDRYIAISKPLLYTVIMSRNVCIFLTAVPYLLGLLNGTVHTSLTFQLIFCKATINHFFCDIPAVISLSCSDTSFNLAVLFGLSFAQGTLSGCIVIISYIYILVATLKIRSTKGRWKVFSTCSSHLTSVSIFYGTLFFIYVRPSSGSTVEEDKVVSMCYTIMIPMLNPMIYSLRNKEVKDAVKRILRRKHFP